MLIGKIISWKLKKSIYSSTTLKYNIVIAIFKKCHIPIFTNYRPIFLIILNKIIEKKLYTGSGCYLI